MSSASIPIPPAWAGQDRGDQITAIFWTEVAVALVFVMTRMYSRGLIRSFGVDDAMMAISMMAFVAYTGVITKIAYLGGFRHLAFVPLENGTQVALLNLVAQDLAVFAYGTSKFSIGYLVLRLLPPAAKLQRYLLWVVISITLFYNWLQVILTFVQCKPYDGAWDVTIPSKCWTENERKADIYVGGVYNILVDVFLALFPLTFIWHLQLTSTKKLGLSILLALSLVASICAMVKLTYVSSLFSADETWSTYNLDVWSGSELFTVIVCGSIPPSKSLWDRCFTKMRAGSEHSYLPSYKSDSLPSYHSKKSATSKASRQGGNYEMMSDAKSTTGEGERRGSQDRILSTLEYSVQKSERV